MPYLMSVKEVSKSLGLSRYTLNGLMAEGKLVGKGFGKSKRVRYITTESVEKFVKGVDHE